MQIKVLNADYSCSPPQIMATLTMPVGTIIQDDLVFTSESVAGIWKIHDFARGAPAGPPDDEQRFLVAVAEAGKCGRLVENAVLLPASVASPQSEERFQKQRGQ